MTFWIFVTLMILVVLAVLLRPLLRSSVRSDADDGRLNLSVYKQQLRELEADHERGLVTADQMQQARMDIERALLHEVPDQPASQNTTGGGKPLLPVIVLSVAVIAVSVTVYIFTGYPQRMDSTQTAGGDMPSPQEMVAQLEQRLERNPEDTRGWLMLARSYSVLGRHEDAVTALERLRERVGDEPGLLVRLANNMAMANDGRFEGRPAALIQQVLEQDPDNPSAIWFAGLAANQRSDYRQAIDYWERLVPKLDGEPEALEKLQEMIGKARAELKPESGTENSSVPGDALR